jgi:dTDP-4-dehydrorhamnose reductase
VKILVTGASGGLGRYVCRVFDVWAPTRAQLDITNAQQTIAVVHEAKPDVVVHLAAVTDTALCEASSAHSVLAVRVNAAGTMNVARACKEMGAYLVYMSTDAVFSGEGPHAEDKDPLPASVYGWSKFAGEQAALAVGGLVVRANFFTRYCRGKTSFAEYVIREARAGRDFGCYKSVVSAPVYAKTLAEHIAAAVKDDLRGVLHVASSDSINRVDQARMICEAYGLPSSGITTSVDKKYDGRLAASWGLCGSVREEIEKMVEEETLCGS